MRMTADGPPKPGPGRGLRARQGASPARQQPGRRAVYSTSTGSASVVLPTPHDVPTAASGGAARVAVFLDYENVHRGGHGMYGGLGEEKYETVVDPLMIAQRIVGKRREPSVLAAVHVFRGKPLPQYQPEATSANDLQAAAWEEYGEVVHLTRRALKYTDNDDGTFSAQEKGIDVALAVSMVEEAMLEHFDVRIVFSNDTDQLPALELAFRRTKPRIEIACWRGAKPLWFPEEQRATPSRLLPYCHFLTEQDFLEWRDYSAAT